VFVDLQKHLLLMRFLRYSFLFALVAVLLGVLSVRYLSVEGITDSETSTYVDSSVELNSSIAESGQVEDLNEEETTLNSQKQGALSSTSLIEEEPTTAEFSEHSMEAWLAKGEELVRFESTD